MNIDLFNQVTDSINIFVGFFCVIIAAGQLMARDKQWFNYIISLLYFSFGVLNLDFAFLASGIMNTYPHLFAVAWPFHFSILPTAYLYIKILVNHDFKPEKKHLAFFLPSFFCTFLLIPLVYIQSAEEKVRLISQIHYTNEISLLYIIFISGIIFRFVIVLLTLHEIRFMLGSEKNKNYLYSRKIILIFLITAIAFIIYLAGALLRNDLLCRIVSLIFDLIIFLPFFLSYRYPDIMHDVAITISKEKYRYSQINGLNIDSAITRLRELLEIEKIFTNPELNITVVSKMLQISSHQLSEIINQRLEVNFRTFINSYRIEEAKKLLIDKPDNTILQIAYTTGFNSKTSFNNTFSKFTSVTPTEYRKNNLKN